MLWTSSKSFQPPLHHILCGSYTDPKLHVQGYEKMQSGFQLGNPTSSSQRGVWLGFPSQHDTGGGSKGIETQEGELRGFTVREIIRKLIWDHSTLNSGVENLTAILQVMTTEVFEPVLKNDSNKCRATPAFLNNPSPTTSDFLKSDEMTMISEAALVEQAVWIGDVRMLAERTIQKLP